MGAWGAGLYEDDIACDVKQAFPERLGRGASVEEASRWLADACRLATPTEAEGTP